MVDINELYITPDGKKMILDVSVKRKSYYKDVYLDEVVIDTQDTYTQAGVSDNWVYKRKISGEDYIAKVAWESGKVDEYLDIMCTLRTKKCHSHHYCNCNDGCGCHKHHNHCHDTCHCRTGETGEYCNPFSIKSIDLTKKTAIDREDVEFPIEEGLFYRFIEPTTVTYGSKTWEIFQDDIYMYNGKDITLYVKDTIPLNVKHARIEILQEDICQPFKDTMFFVYIKCCGEQPNSSPIVTPDCPCGQDNIYTLGVCVNQFPIYNRFMCIMRELLRTCEIPKYFIDLYLRWQSVKMSIETGHYIEAILYWKRFFLFKHQRPLYEQPQDDTFWKDIHQGLPETNYEHPVYGFGGSLFSGTCKRCGR